MTGLKRTLLLTIALPDYYAEDIDQAMADEFYGGDLSDTALEEMSLITTTARLLVAHGDKEGNTLIELRAVIVKADVVDRTPEHDQPEDERLADLIEDDLEREALTRGWS